MRGGYTLVEVIVALVVLEVGLLGVVGTLVLAARTLARAEAIERGAAAIERVVDSLEAAGAVNAGRALDDAGEVVWSPASGGALELVFSTPLDSALLVVGTLLDSVR